MSPEKFYLKEQSIEGFETEEIEEVVSIPKIYGGKCEFQIIVGSQESKENTNGNINNNIKILLKMVICLDMFSFNITTTAKEAELAMQNFEEKNEIKMQNQYF